eukprot:5268033-Lingulodinium_polyedra.AAC.1
MLPCPLAALLPCRLAALPPCRLAALLPCCLAALRRAAALPLKSCTCAAYLHASISGVPSEHS